MRRSQIFRTNIYLRKKLAGRWFRLLQQIICYEFEKIEYDYSKKKGGKPKNFKKKTWQKSNLNNEGGGIFSIIKNGLIFDRVGVNFSEVSGKFNKKFASQVLGAKKNPNYWASGISIVAHMRNPKIPALFPLSKKNSAINYAINKFLIIKIFI